MLPRFTRAGLLTLALAACTGKDPAGTTGTTDTTTTTGTPTGSAGSSTTTDPGTTTSDMLGFAADIWAPIFAPVCTCHRIDGGAGSGELFMGNDAMTAYDAIVDIAAVQLTSMDYVEPGDPDNSYLVHKIENTHLGVGGLGDPMPLGGKSLPAPAIAAIRQWIDEGALP